MKKNFTFLGLRRLLASALCSTGVLLAVIGFAAKEDISLFGTTDINVITGADTSPHIVQSSSSVWAHGNTILVGYNDSRGVGDIPLSICGVSISTDGGATFNRLPFQFNVGEDCYGDPQVYYSVRSNRWYYNTLTGTCGGAGVRQWSSPDGISWTIGSCVFTTNGADIPTAWVDNNSASPFYGRQYALINDFSVGTGAVRSTFSTDNGGTWSPPISVFPNYRSAVKIFGNFGTNGNIYVQTLDNGAGGLGSPRQNFFHRSTDGGSTWSAAISQGATFTSPGRSTCSDSAFYPCMYAGPGYWRHLGYGQPGAGPGNVVHYAYTAGAVGDPGNIYYVRSTDGGTTWSAPLIMNTDATSRAQWGASLSVNAIGQVFVSWYDERNTVGDLLQRYGRASLDNGLTFTAEMPISDVVFPKPLQLDGSVQTSYVGFSDFAAFSNDGNGSIAYHAWTDGRVSIDGSPQQDVFIDQINLGAPIPFTAGNLVIYRVGNSIAALTTAATPVFLDEYTPSGVLVQSIPMPTAVNGTHRRLTANGTATSEGFLNLSTDRRYLTATGYNTAVGTADPSTTTATVNNRVIARVNENGIVDTTTALTDAASSSNPRSAVSTNGTNLWIDGGAGGIRFTTLGATTSTQLSTTQANLRVANISANQLYVSTATGTAFRIGKVGTGTPTTAGQTITNLPGVPANSGSPYAFFFADLNAGVPGDDVLYIADDGGFVRKFSLVGASWVANGTIAVSGVRGLTGVVNGTSVTLYFTTAGAFMTMTDTAGYNVPNNGTTTSRAVARTNTAFRGIAFAPASEAPTVVSAGSRKTHSAAGDFDVNLPRTGTPGNECRTGGATADYTMVVTFANPVSVGGSPQAQVTSGSGAVGSNGVPNGGTVNVVGNTVTVPLTNVTNAQTIQVTLFGVQSVTDAKNGGDIVIPMSVLTGDTNGNGSVNASDVSQTKSRIGQLVDASNFRSDVNLSGALNAGDAAQVKSNVGNGLP